MRPLHILTALLLVALLAGCGTTQHFVPPMPIPPGTAAGTIGVSWSSSRFIPLGLQGNFYLGVAGGNMLGVGFNNFVLPSSFTYVHYERISDLSYANVQLHGTLLGIDPRYELDLGYATRWGETTHAFKLGIGYLSTLQPGVEEPSNRVPAWVANAKSIGEVQVQTLKTVGTLVDENPKQAALIVRDWLSNPT